MSNVMDSRKAHIEDSAPIAELATDAQTFAPPVPGSVPVEVENVVRVLSQKWAGPGYDIYVSYTTYILPGSTAANMSIANVLPQDALRLQGVVRAYNANIVLCKQRDQAQAIGNLQAVTGVTNFPANPQGFVLSPGGNLSGLENNETLWVVNADPTLTAYVSVIIERSVS